MLPYISQPVSGPWAYFPPSGSLCSWMKGFRWLSPRSTTSLIKAVVKKARSEGLPLLSLGNSFYEEALLLAPGCVTSQMGSSEVYSTLYPPPSILPLTPTCWLGFLAFLGTLLVTGTCWRWLLCVWFWSQPLDLILMLICNSASLLIIRDPLSPTFWRGQGEGGQRP